MIDRGDLTQELLIDLEKMRQAGWIERQEERYALTALGQEKAAERLAGDERLGVTDAGKERLSRLMGRTRGRRHRLSTGG